MTPPAVTVIQAWPASMGKTKAAAYLGISVTQLTTICRLYPDRLRTFNLLPNGEVQFRREALDEFLEWRERIGFEKRAG